jgi:hypothetical protein
MMQTGFSGAAGDFAGLEVLGTVFFAAGLAAAGLAATGFGAVFLAGGAALALVFLAAGLVTAGFGTGLAGGFFKAAVFLAAGRGGGFFTAADFLMPGFFEAEAVEGLAAALWAADFFGPALFSITYSPYVIRKNFSFVLIKIRLFILIFS